MDFGLSGIFGGLIGGIFRLLPEVLKFFDRKNERSHELEMFGRQIELEKFRGELKIEERYVDFGVAQMDAINAAMKQQAEADKRAWKWVASLSALVRPGVTYVLFGTYVIFKFIVISFAMYSGADWNELSKVFWTVEDFAMLNMILTFWFVARTIEKYRKE